MVNGSPSGRGSGAPPWAVWLGWGTPDESAGRSRPAKVTAWAVNVLAVAVLLVTWAGVDGIELSSRLLLVSLAIAVALVAGVVAAATITRRSSQR